MNSRKLISAAGIAGALLFTSACSASVAAAPPASSPSASAAETAAPEASAVPVAAATPAPTVSTPAGAIVLSPAGIIPKGVANDGTRDYLQTSIADDDPAMQYNPAIADDAAKAHYTPAQLAEAQKVIVKFIAEEAIDSTLNGGGTNVDGWYAAHKDQILPQNQPILLGDLKAGKDALARESWMVGKPGLAYVHGADKSRVISRGITVTQMAFVDNNGLQGIWLDTKDGWQMAVTGGAHTNHQSSTAELSFAAAIDPADGKWKIAGYDAKYHTAEG